MIQSIRIQEFQVRKRLYPYWSCDGLLIQRTARDPYISCFV